VQLGLRNHFGQQKVAHTRDNRCFSVNPALRRRRWASLSIEKHKLAEEWGGKSEGLPMDFPGSKRTWVTRVTGFWHNPGLQMTKTELQSALAEATQTDRRTAGVFLDTLGALAYKEIKKTGEFVLPGFGKLVKQKSRQISCCQGRKGRGFGGKEVVKELRPGKP
jgi:DNA-binding protein HU-beta